MKNISEYIKNFTEEIWLEDDGECGYYCPVLSYMDDRLIELNDIGYYLDMGDD